MMSSRQSVNRAERILSDIRRLLSAIFVIMMEFEYRFDDATDLEIRSSDPSMRTLVKIVCSAISSSFTMLYQSDIFGAQKRDRTWRDTKSLKCLHSIMRS